LAKTQTILPKFADFHCIATLMHRMKARHKYRRQPLGFCMMIRPRDLRAFFAVPVPGVTGATTCTGCGGGETRDGSHGALPLPAVPAVPLPIQPESGVINGSGLSVGPRLSTGATTTPRPRTRGPDADSYAGAGDEKFIKLTAASAIETVKHRYRAG
jgi:hypothetical protein